MIGQPITKPVRIQGGQHEVERIREQITGSLQMGVMLPTSVDDISRPQPMKASERPQSSYTSSVQAPTTARQAPARPETEIGRARRGKAPEQSGRNIRQAPITRYARRGTEEDLPPLPRQETEERLLRTHKSTESFSSEGSTESKKSSMGEGSRTPSPGSHTVKPGGIITGRATLIEIPTRMTSMKAKAEMGGKETEARSNIQSGSRSTDGGSIVASTQRADVNKPRICSQKPLREAWWNTSSGSKLG